MNNCHIGVTQSHCSNLKSILVDTWAARSETDNTQILYELPCSIQMSQKLAQLPAEKVRMSAPFSCVGSDFAGPLYAKISSNKERKVLL